MLIQEKDAYDYICPVSKANDKQNIGRCSGTRCMAWRWENIAQGRGWCGMAGTPWLKVSKERERF